jgi:hypothetical protein
MNIRAKAEKYLRGLSVEYDRRFDKPAGLLGYFDRSIYPAEYLEQHFDSLNEKSLHSYRESLAYALGLFLLDEKIDRALQIVEVFCRDGQIKDAGSLDFGELFWFKEEKHIRDRNGNFFNGSSLLLIRKIFHEKLRPDQLKLIEESLRMLYPVFVKERARASLTYVNPSLGKFAMCALLAEHFSLPELDSDLIEFSRYADFLLENGVNETLSPTYYTVDIIILLTCLLCGKADILKERSEELLRKLFLAQTFFFKDRFPVPFRRGYNGSYVCRRKDVFAQLLGWNDELENRDNYLKLITPPVIGLASEKFTDLFSDAASNEYPRMLETKVHRDCTALSYLDKDFSLGSFNFYPPETTVWQTVGVGGSGWQDGIVYLTFTNSDETSCILRLEAVDVNDVFKCHPYEGEFKLEKVDRLYPHLSFPPEPEIRCAQDGSSLLCLYKIDKVDAVLKSFGFNLHFSRFNGKVLNLQGNEITVSDHCGPVIIQVADSMIYLQPLERVDMGNSDLLHCAFFEPQVKIQANESSLDLKMLNYEGTAKRFTQNYVSGGFFMHVASGMDLNKFISLVKGFTVQEQWISDGINAHVDRRDSIRKVTVSILGKELSLNWNHYTGE